MPKEVTLAPDEKVLMVLGRVYVSFAVLVTIGLIVLAIVLSIIWVVAGPSLHGHHIPALLVFLVLLYLPPDSSIWIRVPLRQGTSVYNHKPQNYHVQEIHRYLDKISCV